MAVLTLILFAVYILAGFVVRTVLQLRRTGDSGFRGLSGTPGSARWWAGVLFAAALIAGLLGPILALVRNPIFTAMAITGIGLALIVPNVVAPAGAVVLITALHLQVRVVEEPYLLTTHGDTYPQYAATTGRFLPHIGRLLG